jgi:hypothetical protein
MLYINAGVNSFGEGGFITLLSVLQLLLIALLSWKIFQARRVTKSEFLWRDSAMVWALIALGFAFLSVDEVFKIHEGIDHLIHSVFNLQETGVTDRLDDIIIGLYGLIGLGVLFAYRNELKIFKKALPLLFLGFVLLFAMVVLDVLTNRNDIFPAIFAQNYADILYLSFSLAEDSAKVFAEASFVLAFFVILQKAKYLEGSSTVCADS